MKASEYLEKKREGWHELERLCDQMQKKSQRKMGSQAISRFASLYRSACADLALADTYQLPPGTIHYLHQLVGRAHNQLYRGRRFHFHDWGEEMFVRVPQRLFNDYSLRLAFCIFWGFFGAAWFLSSASSPYPDFAEDVIGEQQLTAMEDMHAGSIDPDASASGMESLAFGFYVNHNTSIGLQCFAWGVFFGVAGIFVTLFNAIYLGAVFGYMTRAPENARDNFFEFVTAHGPFELTAIVLSAAAGMRLGFSLINTGGLGRLQSFRRAGSEAMPTMCAAIVMFVLAALIEGFLSPSSAPYAIKAVVAAVSCGLLLFYFVVLGYPRSSAPAREPNVG